MMQKQSDVIIIGSGISGLMLAHLLCKHKHVTILTKGEWFQSNSYMAQGGIAAATTSDDHWSSHFHDTLQAGNFHNNKEMVKTLVRKGPELVRQLIDLGVPFDRDERGNFSLGQEGAHSKRRILHAGGDQTGKEIIRVLYESVKNNVTVVEKEMVMNLIVKSGRCYGLWTKNEQGENTVYFANHIILASGGLGQLYPITSNNRMVSGDGFALAYRAGCELADLEFIQFHPTVLVNEGKCFGLVSEALRGEGARLVDDTGTYIMEDHPQKDLAPRDVVARKIYQIIQSGKKVFLDVRPLIDFQEQFPTVFSLCQQAKVDLKSGLIPVAPGAHFIMGGVMTNGRGETNIDRLYVIGEAARTGVHGANRLASNSLLEGIVFANECASSILEKSDQTTKWQQPIIFQNKQANILEKSELQQMMMKYLGIIRNEQGLTKLIEWLETFLPHIELFDEYERKTQEFLNMVQTAWLVATSAKMRKESRGGHYRSDYPFEIDTWKEKLVIRKEGEYEQAKVTKNA